MVYKIKRPVTTDYIPLSDMLERRLDNEWKAQLAEQIQIGTKVKLRRDVSKRHAQSVPAHAGFTKEQFAWRKTLDELEEKTGVVTRLFPNSEHVNVDFGGHLIGINKSELIVVGGSGWHGDSIGHSLAALKAQTTKANNTPMRTTKEHQPKDIWLSIRSNEMMRDTMKALIQEIKSHNIEYTSYASGNGNRLYLHLKNCPKSFNKELGNWIYYNPITQMKKPPNISDYDITDW